MNHPVQDPPLLKKEEFDDKKRKKKVKKREALKKKYFRIFTFPFPIASHTTESKSIKGRTTEHSAKEEKENR